MNRHEFTLIGPKYGLTPLWRLAELDSLSYAHFLEDLTKFLPLSTPLQIHEFILSAENIVWEDQDKLFEYFTGEKLPYRNWSPIQVKNVLDAEKLHQLRDYLKLVLKKPDLMFHCTIFNRYALHDSPYLQQLHKEIKPFMEKLMEKELEITYSYLSMYDSNGYCPPHRDRNVCQWTLDLCVNQDKQWPLFVEDKTFHLKENEALVYSGTDQLHWRERIHTNGHCDLVFFHFKEK
jgi:hypothetical protein